MPITVVCPGCKAGFSVSEKFAGKKGPCPKCKQIITVPAAPPPKAPAEEVKIHAPDEFRDGGKDKKGRPITKPIPREETRFNPRVIATSAVGSLVVILLAWLLRYMNAESRPAFVFLGLLVISPPLAVAAYSFLRNDELEPYRGRSLWIRAAICGLVYAILWDVYYFLPPDFGEAWQWVFAVPIFAGLGAATAWGCFDLEFGNGVFHYSFYVLITLVLRGLIGLPPVWVMGA